MPARRWTACCHLRRDPRPSRWCGGRPALRRKAQTAIVRGCNTAATNKRQCQSSYAERTAQVVKDVEYTSAPLQITARTAWGIVRTGVPANREYLVLISASAR